MEKESQSEDNNHHSPDAEEVYDAIVFMNNCETNDLLDVWQKVSCEWDLRSIVKVHRSLCDSGRIHKLLEVLGSQANGM